MAAVVWCWLLNVLKSTLFTKQVAAQQVCLQSSATLWFFFPIAFISIVKALNMGFVTHLRLADSIMVHLRMGLVNHLVPC